MSNAAHKQQTRSLGCRKTEEKRISMRRRSGRPRANLKQKILADMSHHEKGLEALVPKGLLSLTRGMVYEAACSRLTLEKGTLLQKAICAPLIEKLRGTRWARANDPSRRLSDREFLERYIEAHAPGFDWRQDALQGEKEDQEHERENERIAKEFAEDARYGMAQTTKFCTPDAPDGVLLAALAWDI
jgi:hypothetical protein